MVEGTIFTKTGLRKNCKFSAMVIKNGYIKFDEENKI